MAPAIYEEKKTGAAPVIRQYSDSTGFAFATAPRFHACLSLGPSGKVSTYLCNWGDGHPYTCYTRPRLKGIPPGVDSQQWKSLRNALAPRGVTYPWSGVVG